MKIPSVTQETKPPAATVQQPATLPVDAAPPPRPVVVLEGEDGETVSIVAPPQELLARLQADAAATDTGTATAEELARQLAAVSPPTHGDAAQHDAALAADPASPHVISSTTMSPASTESPDTAAVGPSPAVPAAVDDRQPFKVVLRLKPISGNRWHATIGIGRDGCDPCWEGSDIDDWPEALDSVLGVYAAAEARWATQPRNPRPAVTPAVPRPVTASAAVPAGPTTSNGKPKGKDAGKSTAVPPPPAITAATAAPPPVPAADPAPVAGVEKLTLF